MSVSIKDFHPVNSWKPDEHGQKWSGSNEPAYLIDRTTGRRYFNESQGVVRFKCLLLTLGTPIVHTAASIINVAYRILKLVTLSHFWAPKKEESRYDFKARLTDAGKDVLRIVATPFSLLGLELASIYGVFRPYDGRKLYASIERATYGNFILAPCFQPEPTRHALGGDVKEKDAW
jgi:hypothetical protein